MRLAVERVVPACMSWPSNSRASMFVPPRGLQGRLGSICTTPVSGEPAQAAGIPPGSPVRAPTGKRQGKASAGSCRPESTPADPGPRLEPGADRADREASAGRCRRFVVSTRDAGRRDCGRGGSRLIRGCERAFASGPGCHERDPDQGRSARRGVSRQCGGDGRFGRGSARQSRKNQAGRRGGRARAASRAWQAVAAGSGAGAARSGLAVSRALAARGVRHVWGRGAGRRADHRDRPGRGPGMPGDRQRCHGQGRHLLSDHREEASAGAGDRAREPAGLRLSGRFRRRQSAEPGRGVSGPRALRADLLQPGDHVGGRDRADRGGHGLLHGGRRLCAGDGG